MWRWPDYRKHYGATIGALVVNDLVISGRPRRRGSPRLRGRVPRVHRRGSLALPGAPLPGEPEARTWVGRALEHGCGSAWLTGHYDLETDSALLANRQSVSRLQRRRAPRDNLYTSSVLALHRAPGSSRGTTVPSRTNPPVWESTTPTIRSPTGSIPASFPVARGGVRARNWCTGCPRGARRRVCLDTDCRLARRADPSRDRRCR